MSKEQQRPHPVVVLHKIAEEWSYKAGPFFVSSVSAVLQLLYLCLPGVPHVTISVPMQ